MFFLLGGLARGQIQMVRCSSQRWDFGFCNICNVLLIPSRK